MTPTPKILTECLMTQSDLNLADLETSYLSFLETAIALKTKYSSQILLLIGLESDYITDIDLSRTLSLINSRTEIDYIVGSVHHVGGIPIDFDRNTWLRAVYAAGRGEEGAMMSVEPDGSVRSILLDGSIPQLQPDYSPSLAELLPFILAYLDQQYYMIQALRPEVIGHFDLFRLWTPDMDVRCAELNPEQGRGVWEAIERNVREVVGYGGVFEINTAAFRKGWDTAYPCRAIAEVRLRQNCLRKKLMIQLIISLGGKFCFSDDSHGTAQVGLNYHRLKSYCQSLGLDEITYLSPGNNSASTQEAIGDKQRSKRIISRNKKDIWDHPFWKSH